MRDDELDLIRTRLAAAHGSISPASVATAVRDLGMVVSDSLVLEVMDRLRQTSVGAGVLEPLLTLPGVTDVLVNGPDQVFVDRGRGLERASVRFGSDDAVRQLATRMAAAAGRRLDDSSPFVDARLADGTRVHAVLSPIAEPGTCLSLRIPGRTRLGLDDWRLPPRISELLRAVMERRLAFLVSGGTGSGKTTLLATLLGLAPADERIVICEDSRELIPDHPHCVRLESRPANAEGAGAIRLTDLVRQALRMRPDRLIVGEVRGAELCDLLSALNTGHEGGCGTVHANSVVDVPARLEALAALGGLDRGATHAQVAAAVDIVIHVARESGARRVAEVGVVRRGPDGVAIVAALSVSPAGVVTEGPGWDRLARRLS